MKRLSWPVLAGAVLGVVAPLLVAAGNPGNMGVCVACFLRDTTGALGLHRAAAVQYIRPEILGLVLGGMLGSLLVARNFRPGATSSQLVKFFLGLFAMIGALVFLGCPWRVFLRLGGGDMTALAGFAGLFAGAALGYFAKTRGGCGLREDFMENRVYAVLPPLFVIALGVLYFFASAEQAPFATAPGGGPGAMHAPFLLSLAAGVGIGVLFQKSQFCTMGALANVWHKDFSMLWGVVALVLCATLTNLLLGQYHFGMEGQPIAHTQHVYSFVAMTLSGLCFSLAGGCPGKHLARFGAGNADSGIFVLGMMVGGAISHNFALAASPKGVGANTELALAAGFVFCLLVMLAARGKGGQTA